MFAGTALSVRLFVCAGLSLFIIYGPYLYVVVCVFYAYNLTLEYSGIEIRQFTHSAEIKREIPFCTCKRILEYSGIEIRQFTHSAEIKREIPFCTRKRSETYLVV